MMGFWDLVRLELRTLLADRAIMLTLFGGVFFYSFLYPQPYLHQLPARRLWWWPTMMAASSPVSWSSWPTRRPR